MTILHVTDFHSNKRWFDWLLHRAPAHDLVVMSGDMLDLGTATPQRRQIEWVVDDGTKTVDALNRVLRTEMPAPRD